MRISSVAYADDDRLSDAKTASAVGLPSRSWASREVGRAGPRIIRLSAYPGLGGRARRPRVAAGIASRRVSGPRTFMLRVSDADREGRVKVGPLAVKIA